MTIENDQKALAGLSIDQLRAIRMDFHNPEELCDLAAQLSNFCSGRWKQPATSPFRPVRPNLRA